jgi:hypothetical protein
MFRRLVMLALLAGAALVLREIAPDIRRYFTLKRM